jgi:hypothetical protein
MQTPEHTTPIVPAVHYQIPYQGQPRTTSGLAVASMIIGILSVLGAWVFLIPPLLAVIFGHSSLGSCNKNPQLDGKGMAIAGLVMGWLCLTGWILFILFFGGLAILGAIGAAAGQ